MTMNRRDFLVASATTAATATVVPHCLGNESRDLPALKFIVLSDTHVGYKYKDSAAKQWEKTAQHVARTEGDFVLHLGDVVDRGQEDQYAVYLKSREQISVPVHEIPGNHDPLDIFEKHLKTTADRVVDHQWLRVVLMNNARRESHNGFLTEKQLDWLESVCAQAAKKDKYIVLAMHVTAHANKHPDRGWYVKPADGQTRFYEILEEFQSRVLATFHGHFHNGVRGWQDKFGVHELCFPSSLYNLNRKLKENGATGFNVLEFQPSFTKVTLDRAGFHFQIQPVGLASDQAVAHTCKISPKQ